METRALLKLSATEQTELARILGCREKELSARLSPFATAALREHVLMVLGQKVFSRGQDLLEHRLLLLIQYVFNNEIPNEQEVSKLFQTTATQSRALIRAVMSKYQYHLSEAIDRSIKALLEGAVWRPQKNQYALAVHSLNLVDELNLRLAAIDANLPQVVKKKGSVSAYVINPSSYDRVCELVGAKAVGRTNE